MPAATEPPSANSRRALDILLLEDHAESRTVIAKLLGHCGHRVITAEGLAEANAALAQRTFDVLLSDLGLLDGEAFDLVRALKESHGVRLAIALTGHPPQQDGERARAAGFDHYLTKPADFHELRSLLEKVPAA